VGVRLFNAVVNRVDWNRGISGMRGYAPCRAGLRILDRKTRESETAHVLGAAVTVAAAAAALFAGSGTGAAWIGATGILIHVYPMMVQRSVRYRLQGLADWIG